jgi:hypothetical protein
MFWTADRAAEKGAKGRTIRGKEKENKKLMRKMRLL